MEIIFFTAILLIVVFFNSHFEVSGKRKLLARVNFLLTYLLATHRKHNDDSKCKKAYGELDSRSAKIHYQLPQRTIGV